MSRTFQVLEEAGAHAEGETHSPTTLHRFNPPGASRDFGLDLSAALPSEVLWLIAQRLDPADLRSLGATSRLFRALVRDDALWHAVYVRMWRGSRARLPPAEGTPALGQWRLAVEKRERTLRWAALLATEGQEEPSSVIADEHRRCDYLAELVAILAERSEAAKQIRSLGEGLISGIWQSTIDPVLDNRRPLSVVRLAYVALADLVFDDLPLGFILKTHMSRLEGHSLRVRCSDRSLAMRMAAAYLHAVLSLSWLLDVKGRSIKIPASLLPLEVLGEDDAQHTASNASMPPSTPISGTAIWPNDVRILCQTLTGSWRGYYVFPTSGASEEEMRLTLTVTESGAVIGEGRDLRETFTLEGGVQFDTGLLTFDRSYAAHTMPYCGKITPNGIAGTWGSRQWSNNLLLAQRR